MYHSYTLPFQKDLQAQFTNSFANVMPPRGCHHCMTTMNAATATVMSPHRSYMVNVATRTGHADSAKQDGLMM